MRTQKSQPGDKELIYDENIDVGERASALFRLAVDGYSQMEPLLVSLLNHNESMLRGEAIKILLNGWNLPQYLDDAVKMLHNDPDDHARSDAAFSLGQFARYCEAGIEQQDFIIKELIYQLINDEKPFVQSTCYDQLLGLLAPERGYVELPDDFSLERDVDWKLLTPYVNDKNTGV
jgi:hypothetical protein